VEPGEFQPAAGIQHHLRVPRDRFLRRLSIRAGRLQDRTALVLDPKGRVVEQFTSAPVQRAFASAFGDRVREVQLRDILQVIDTATKDTRIERLVLVPDEIEGAGMATLREIGAALDRFEKAGKEVIAVSTGMTQSQYYLAAHASPHPVASGRRRAARRPRPLPHVLQGCARQARRRRAPVPRRRIQVGGEPLYPQRRLAGIQEADLYWMNGVWSDYLADIGAARKLDPKTIAAQIDDYTNSIKAAGGDVAKLALDQNSSTSSPRATKPCRC
jgi:protease-4